MAGAMTCAVTAPAVTIGPCLVCHRGVMRAPFLCFECWRDRLDEYDAIIGANQGCTAASLVGAAGAENTREVP